MRRLARRAVTLGDSDTCKDVRIVLGCVGLTAIRAKEAEKTLREKKLEKKRIDSAVEAVRAAAEPQETCELRDYKRVLIAAPSSGPLESRRGGRAGTSEAGHEYVGR